MESSMPPGPGVIVVAERPLHDLLSDHDIGWNVQERQPTIAAMWDALSGGRLDQHSRILVFSDSLLADTDGEEPELIQTARAIVAMANAGAQVFIAAWRPDDLSHLEDLIADAAAAQGLANRALTYHRLPADGTGRAVLEAMRSVLGAEVVFPDEWPADVDDLLERTPSAPPSIWSAGPLPLQPPEAGSDDEPSTRPPLNLVPELPDEDAVDGDAVDSDAVDSDAADDVGVADLEEVADVEDLADEVDAADLEDAADTASDEDVADTASDEDVADTASDEDVADEANLESLEEIEQIDEPFDVSVATDGGPADEPDYPATADALGHGLRAQPVPRTDESGWSRPPLPPIGTADSLSAETLTRATEYPASASLELLGRPMRPGQVTVTVTSSKGGSGKSTASVMLGGSIARASRAAGKQLSVVVVDLDTRDGQVASLIGKFMPTALNIRVQPVWDEECIRRNLVHAEGLGIDTLLAPIRPRTADTVGPEFYRTIIRSLQRMYDVVIMDTSVQYLDPLIADVALVEADEVLFVTTLASTAVQGMARALREITAPVDESGLGVPREKIGIIVNQSVANVGMERDQVLAAGLGVPVVGVIPLATKDVLTATNRHRMYALLDHPLIGPAYNQLARACLPSRALADWASASDGGAGGLASVSSMRPDARAVGDADGPSMRRGG